MIVEGLRYLRVSLIDQCNMHCSYCRPHGEESAGDANLADFEKVTSAISLLHRLGVRKIRFTGGEPTLYNRLREIVAFTRALDGNLHLAMTTNGRLLDRMAPELAQKGLDSVNVSLDTLDRSKFSMIAGIDALDQVIRGIRRATESKLTVKLNSVVVRGVNDEDVEQLIRFADEECIDIRFIELMPARFSCHATDYVSSAELISRLPFTLTAVPSSRSSASRYYTAPDLRIRVGFIAPVSRPFCGSCDRIRLAANGKLFACLFSKSSVDFYDLMAEGPDSVSACLEHLIRTKPTISSCETRFGKSDLPSLIEMGG